jgi:riboflavin biosynthesis pyrimidine reductase
MQNAISGLVRAIRLRLAGRPASPVVIPLVPPAGPARWSRPLVPPAAGLVDWLAVRQIFPAAATAPEIGPAGCAGGPPPDSVVAALAALYAYPGPAPGAAAWVRATMIASVDGAASLDGRSGGLSGGADRTVFKVLRSLADVILAGAATARAERYRPVRDSEVWAGLRQGRAPTPPIAVITRELSLPADDPLLTQAPGQARTVVLTTERAPAARRAAVARHADVAVAGQDSVSPAEAVAALARRGHRRIQVEGGPSLLGQFVAAGLLDELCITVSPMVEGGRAARIVTAPPGVPAGGDGPASGLSLAHVLEDRGFLFCRYLRADPRQQ